MREEGEHNVENFMLCRLRITRTVRCSKKSCARWFWQFLFGCDLLLSVLRGLNLWRNSPAIFLTLQSCQVCVCNTRWCALVVSLNCCQFVCPLFQRLSLLSIKDGLQQFGERTGWETRHVQVSQRYEQPETRSKFLKVFNCVFS